MKPRRIRLTTMALLGLAMLIATAPSPSPAAARKRADVSLASAQARFAREAAIARDLVAGLRLSRPQARQLLSVLHDAAIVQTEQRREEARLLPAMVEALRDFATEDSLNRGFSRAVERRTARLHHQGRELHEQTINRLIALEQQASEILTAAQRDSIERFPSNRRSAKAGARRQGRTPRAGRHRVAKRRHRSDTGDPRLNEAVGRLHDLQKTIHPQVGTIGRLLLHPAAGEALCRITHTRPSDAMHRATEMLQRGTEACPIDEYERQRQVVAQFRAEINNWNLINGLHLSRQQIEQIASLCDAHVAGAKQAKHRRRRSQNQNVQALVALDRAVERVLSPGQRQVLADYKACLIPPKNLKNPVRTGQANDHSRFEQWLSRARKAKGDRLRKLVKFVIEKEAEKLGESDEATRQKRISQLYDAARQAAAMSDTEFELSRADLAEQLEPPNRIRQMRQDIRRLARKDGLPGPVTQFMLKPKFIEQLRIRGRQLANGVVTVSADLSGGPQAPNCEKGCAVKSKPRARTRQPRRHRKR